MGVILGSGEFRYEVIEGWGKLPDGWTFNRADKADGKRFLNPFDKLMHGCAVKSSN